jgi:tRNA pseudouridine13 synthase
LKTETGNGAAEQLLDQAIHVLAHARDAPRATGRLRCAPQDFQVSEIPLLEPDGAGEHIWLWVRKCNANTPWVAEQLAAFAGIHPRQVSYAGLKDRRAETEQWFSVQLPGCAMPDWAAIGADSFTVLRHARHSRKLRRGALRGNAFRICIRDLHADPVALERRLQLVAEDGVPNYFGEQRFGRDGGNLRTADRLFRNPARRLSRNQRSLALSAVRSFLFNRVLSERVAAGSWNRPIPGDALQLQGSHSFFVAPDIDATLQARVQAGDIHPTGPLHGRGEPPVQGACLALERRVLADYPDWLQGLEAAGLKQDRRALRLPVPDLRWRLAAPDRLVLEFSLPAGAYATSVLRELVVNEAAGA